MRADITAVVEAMARREAVAALLPPPLEETGAAGPSLRVRLVTCPTCGTREHERDWAPPFGSTAGPVLAMLACETLTARAVLPIVAMTMRYPGLGDAEFRSRALTWLDVAHLDRDKALRFLDTAECWITDPAGTDGRTLPASTRRHRRGEVWPAYRRDLTPSFLSPHPAVPASLEERYAVVRCAAVVAAYGRTR
jgi:hypothetical protein